jgi:Immunoglobulin domain/Immunoglobulin I-set domain
MYSLNPFIPSMIKLKSLFFGVLMAVFLNTGAWASTATVLTGHQATFSYTANGTGPFTQQWNFNGAAIPGATSATYVIASVALANAGVYTVKVSNSAGSTLSDNATLTVQSLPVFTTQPTSQAATIGSSVSFTVVATGTPAPTLQWQFNGVNIAGATSATYTVSSVQSANAGTYTCVATSAAGTVTSVAATLTVNAVAPSNVITNIAVQ